MAELDSQPKAIQSLYSWYSNGQLFVNRRYQRKLVWTQKEKQKLVESVLKKYPVPAILLAERDSGSYEIIDGLQRLHTLLSFIENAFPTLEGKYFDITQFPTAKARAETKLTLLESDRELLSISEVSTYLDYSMAVSVMRGADESEIDDVFGRINTYGHRLSEQERRQAGVQDEFSTLVRQLSSTLRGDASGDLLELSGMPSISVDLPKTKHGYEVIADEVFWVNQGILMASDLRDSMDEQCVADVTASIVGGQLIPRSKDALDSIYEAGSPENVRVVSALNVYGPDRFASEFKYCVDQILQVCLAGEQQRLRNILFKRRATNAFPSVFAVLLIAFHESLVQGRNRIADYAGIKAALTGLSERINTSRSSTSREERRRNVDAIKGLIANHLVEGRHAEVYGPHSTTDIDSAIRRSEIELPHYELKQGLLRLDASRAEDPSTVTRVVETICAMANSGPGRTGTVMIGVADKAPDAARIAELDAIQPRKVGSRYVVGVRREAAVLGLKLEEYFAKWKLGIQNSKLSSPLKEAVLSAMDYNDYYGFGLIVIAVPAQISLSYVDGVPYWRSGDETRAAADFQKAAELGARFGSPSSR
jgi:hypothetical protein